MKGTSENGKFGRSEDLRSKLDYLTMLREEINYYV